MSPVLYKSAGPFGLPSPKLTLEQVRNMAGMWRSARNAAKAAPAEAAAAEAAPTALARASRALVPTAEGLPPGLVPTSTVRHVPRVEVLGSSVNATRMPQPSILSSAPRPGGGPGPLPPPIPVGTPAPYTLSEGLSALRGAASNPTVRAVGGTAGRAAVGGLAGSSLDAANNPGSREWMRQDLREGGLGHAGRGMAWLGDRAPPGAFTAAGAALGGAAPWLGRAGRVLRHPAVGLGVGGTGLAVGTGGHAMRAKREADVNAGRREGAEAAAQVIPGLVGGAAGQAHFARHDAAAPPGTWGMMQHNLAAPLGEHVPGGSTSGSDGGSSVANLLGRVPNWGKGLGIGAGALGAGMLARHLLKPDDDEEEGVLPSLAGAGVGLGGAALGAHLLSGGNYGKLMDPSFWKSSGVHKQADLLSMLPSLPRLPSSAELSSALPGEPPAAPGETPGPTTLFGMAGRFARNPSLRRTPAAAPAPAAPTAPAPEAPVVPGAGRPGVPGAGRSPGVTTRPEEAGVARPTVPTRLPEHADLGYRDPSAFGSFMHPREGGETVGWSRGVNAWAPPPPTAGRTGPAPTAPAAAPASPTPAAPLGEGRSAPGAGGSTGRAAAPGAGVARNSEPVEPPGEARPTGGNLEAIANAGMAKQFRGDPTAVEAAARPFLMREAELHAPPEVRAAGPQGIMGWARHIWEQLGNFGPKIMGVSMGHILMGLGLGLGAIGLMSTAGNVAGGKGPGMMGPLLGLGGLAGAGYLGYRAMNTADSSGGLAAASRPTASSAGSRPPGEVGGTAPTSGSGSVAALTPEAKAAEIASLASNPATAAYFSGGAPNQDAIIAAVKTNPESLRPAVAAMSPAMRQEMAKMITDNRAVLEAPTWTRVGKGVPSAHTAAVLRMLLEGA